MTPREHSRAIMERLRAPGGCPWDREQTHASLRPFVLEETYEVLEAIDAGDRSMNVSSTGFSGAGSAGEKKPLKAASKNATSK